MLSVSCVFSAKYTEPSADSPLWNFLPSWYFNKEIAISRISYILKLGGAMPVMKKSAIENPVENKVFEVKTPYFHTLGHQIRDGLFGRYTPMDYTTPKDEKGVGIYNRVIDSCKVSIPIVHIGLS